MSKLKAGETAVWVTEQAVQILGGYGYIKDFPVEKWYRDSKIYTIFEGTSRDPADRDQPGALPGDPQRGVFPKASVKLRLGVPQGGDGRGPGKVDFVLASR